MREAIVTVTNDVGLHARPAATFVKKAAEFESDITITNLTRSGEPVNAKSVVSVFKAAVAKDHEIRLTADGADEDAALDALVDLIESFSG